jgi:cytochrome b561
MQRGARIPSSPGEPKMKQVSRYHPLLVTLHWVLAVLIIAALAVGFFRLAATPNSDPQKIGVLRVHMAGIASR